MTIADRHRTHPIAVRAYTLPIVREIPVHAATLPSQKELVAWSLLTRPDRPASDSR